MKDLKFWTYSTYRNRYKFTKRFVVYLYTWWYGDYREQTSTYMEVPYKTNDYAEFDTMSEVIEYTSMIEEMYMDVWKPQEIPEHWEHIKTGEIKMYKPKDLTGYRHIEKHIECEKNKQFFWGYAILDYEKEEIVRVSHDIHPEFMNYKKDLKLKDILFRKPGEVPEGYKWDGEGEYQGWLQFRWGNGLNAIEVEDEMNRKKQEKEREERKIKREDRQAFEEENRDLMMLE